MIGASAHRVTAMVVVLFVVIVIVSLLGASPTFHQALGIGSTDALDEGALIPKMSTSTTRVAPVFGVFALVVLLTMSTARSPHAANMTPAGVHALVRPRAAGQQRSRVRRSANADDDGHSCTSILTTPALRSAFHSALAEGFSVYTPSTTPFGEEG